MLRCFTISFVILAQISLHLTLGDPLPAYVTLDGEETDEIPAEMRLSSTLFAQGTFSTSGTHENAEGRLCLVDKDFFLNFHKMKSERKKWIGLIQYHMDDEDPVVEEKDNRGNKVTEGQDRHRSEQKKSFTEKMKELILLGASALIIVVKNVRLSKEFDVTQVLTKPIVLLHGVKNVTKIFQLISLRYKIFAKIQKSLPYYSLGTVGTVTLWATCGRSTSGAYHEWQGVVCVGNSRFSSKDIDDCFLAMTWNLCFLLFIYFFIYTYIMLSQDSLNGMTDLENEVENKELVKHVLSQMRIEVYQAGGHTSARKSKRTFLQKESSIDKFENPLDHCVICLDSYFPLQKLRILPCNHSYHLTCIDRWLLARHTCPMCKFDILDHHRLSRAAEPGETSR